MNPHDIASPEKPVVVIGAGPAGLTAAYELSQRGVPVKILEGDDQIGGLARTVQFKGFWFDIGGHRFFTKVDVVKGLWKTLLGDDLRVRTRMSRIFYRGHFFDYPLKPLNALSGLGLLESIRVMLSYLRVKVSPIRPESSLDEWVSNRFGRRLFSIFFKTYTEKVWGIPCHKISAQWAAQRIKGLSLRTALMRTLFPGRGRGAAIRTLIEEFYYPRLGPGMMWNALCQLIEREGGEVLLGNTVTRLRHSGGMVTYVEVKKGEEVHVHDASHVLSSMPLRDFVRALDPAAPSDVLSAVGRLKYRDFLTVIVIVDEAAVFPDNWIYIHDESVKVGRIQNFKNWSSDMVPDGTKTCLGLEYFCFEGDELWSKKDEELVDLARRELGAIGLVSPAKVLDGTVVRMPKAYPMYDEGYREALEEVRAYLGGFANVQLLGRNGMHKYNNMDHSMLTALLAVRNLFGEQHDLWAINTDEEYHETGGVRDIESGVDLGSREKRTSEGVRK